MPTFRAQVVIPYFTAIPSDVVTNTWHFNSLVPRTKADVAAVIGPILATFYGSVYSPSRMSTYMRPLQATLRIYDLDEPTPRVPVIVAMPITAVTQTDSVVPTEVAAVLSFQGDRVSGIPQARRRGRIYLGGLAAAAMSSGSTTAFPLLNGLFTGGIRTAAGLVMTSSFTANLPWSVWSTVSNAPVVVTNGWVDSAPDTQRRRGVESNIRSLWP